MKYLKRDAIAARINDVVAAVAADPKADGKLGGFAVRSSGAQFQRAKPTDEDVERIRVALGDDAAGSRILPFIVSTDKRQGDGLALNIGGAKTARYAKNPVVLYNHSWWRMPVGHSVVWGETASDTGGRMRSLVAMMSRELSTSLDRGFSWALGELAAARGHAASIGFDVLRATPAPPDVRANNPWAMDVDEWDLLEWSLVQIPMDADAVSEHRAHGGDVDPLSEGFSRMLDELEHEDVDRKRIEGAWAAASHGRTRFHVRQEDAAGISAIGPRVRVRAGSEHDDMTMGATGRVVELGGPALGILFEGMEAVHRWYVADELEAVAESETPEKADEKKKKPGHEMARPVASGVEAADIREALRAVFVRA